MRWSQYFIPTLREDPADAEVVSHKLCCGPESSGNYLREFILTCLSANESRSK
jgi:hypothetical protein